MSLNSAIFLQPIQFLVSLIFLSIFISWKSLAHQHYSDKWWYNEYKPNFDSIDRVYNYITLDYPTVILLLGFLNLFICFSNLGWKIKISESEHVETDVEANETHLKETNLTEDTTYTIKIDFTAVLNDDLDGFYRSSYFDEEGAYEN